MLGRELPPAAHHIQVDATGKVLPEAPPSVPNHGGSKRTILRQTPPPPPNPHIGEYTSRSWSSVSTVLNTTVKSRHNNSTDSPCFRCQCKSSVRAISVVSIPWWPAWKLDWNGSRIAASSNNVLLPPSQLSYPQMASLILGSSWWGILGLKMFSWGADTPSLPPSVLPGRSLMLGTGW